MARLFEHVFIVGTGLIGASLGLALGQSGAVGHVSGWDRDPAHAAAALERGALHTVRPRLDAVDADLIVIASPVGAMPHLLAELAPTLADGAVVTDVGSVKMAVLAAAAAVMPSQATFIGGHPIAGKETSGPAVADADLFDGARWVLCPSQADDRHVAATARLSALVQAVGAQPVVREPAAHDAQMAAVSHLPQVASSALALAGAAAVPDEAGRVALAAGGWRDMTRLAGSSPDMWRDICVANDDHVLEVLDVYMATLATFREAIAAQDKSALHELFDNARRVKRHEAAAWEAVV